MVSASRRVNGSLAILSRSPSNPDSVADVWTSLFAIVDRCAEAMVIDGPTRLRETGDFYPFIVRIENRICQDSDRFRRRLPFGDLLPQHRERGGRGQTDHLAIAASG